MRGKPSFALAIVLVLAVLSGVALAEDFNWGPTLNISTLGYAITGQSFTSPVKDQGSWGTCWDFAATATLEARYKLTRNDTVYSIDLSEQQVPMTLGNYGGGGWSRDAMAIQVSSGIVQESELPYRPYSTTFESPASEWPLKDGWQNRAVKATSYTSISTSTANMKAMLKLYGPMAVGFDGGSTDFYWPGGAVPSGTGAANHEVLLVGYHDATAADSADIQRLGGYWIIKNSWSTGWGSYGGYGFVPYTYLENHNDLMALTGPAYYTGAMATATWKSGNGTWSSGGSNWTTSSGNYAWQNRETTAVFNASGAGATVTISGTAIAHGLTVNAGAVGYVFTGGALTVTNGGIVANESVTINSPVTVGAPQTWTTAAGKTLSVNDAVHTVISDLTVDGAGDTRIGGAIDGGGAANTQGAAPGNLVKNGTGTLTVAGASNYPGAIALNAGVLEFAPATGLTASYSGVISGGGSLKKSGLGTVVLAGANTFTGATNVTGGTLKLSAANTLSSATINVNSGAILDVSAISGGYTLGSGKTLAGAGSIAGDVIAGSGSILAPGAALTFNSGFTLGAGAQVQLSNPGSNLALIQGVYTDARGTHTLLCGGTMAVGDTKPFLQWTGAAPSGMADGQQSNWGTQPVNGAKYWIGSASNNWTNASSWDGYAGQVWADLTAKTLAVKCTALGVAPVSTSDAIIDPAASGVVVTGPNSPAVTLNSLQVGGTNNSGPTLTLGNASFTVTGAVSVLGNGALNAVSGGLVAPMLNVGGENAAVTLGKSTGSVTTANVSAGLLTVDAGTVATVNLSGSGRLAGSQTLPAVNVLGGVHAFSGKATTMTVTGGGVTTSGGTIGTFNSNTGADTSTIGISTVVTTTYVRAGTVNFNSNSASNGSLTLPAGSTGTVVVGAGARTSIVTLPSQGAAPSLTAPAGCELTVTSKLTQTIGSGGLTITAGATPFKVAGSNVVNNIDTLVLQGATTTIDASLSNRSAGLEVRAWQNTTNQIEGTLFAMPGTPTHSTAAGTIGYATQSINMSGIDQEHFGAGTNSGVPDSSVRPTGYMNSYTVEYRGKLYIPADGLYRFATTSDDGSALWIDQGDASTANPAYSAAAVQNNYLQAMTTRSSGQMSLTAGYHDFIVRMYEASGGNGLQVQWDPTGGTNWAAIPGANFFHGNQTPTAASLATTDVLVTSSSTLNLNYAAQATLGNLKFSGGALSFQTATSVSFNNIQAAGDSSIAAGVPIALRTGQVTVDGGRTLTVNAAIVSGAVSKLGGGTLTLSGANTYAGATTISEGTLQLATAGSLASNLITVASGATFNVSAKGGYHLAAGNRLQGSGTIVGDLIIDSGAVQSPGNSPGIQTLQGSYVMNGQVQIEIQGAVAGVGYDQVRVADAVARNVALGGNLTLVWGGSNWSSASDKLWILTNETTGTLTGTFGNYAANGMSVGKYDNRDWQIFYGANFATGSQTGGNDVLIMAVPEPSTLALLGVGMLLLAGLARRRQWP